MNIDPEEAQRFLDEQDRVNGINTVGQNASSPTPESEPTSLGKLQSYQSLELSAAEESPWKILDLNLLPSKGLFYPDDAELLLRSAKTKEIRHWSTIDENDPIDVREKINFILNSCTKFKIRGNSQPLNFNDFLEVDRYHILFRIYELTFPNRENKLMAYIKCENTQCGHVNETLVNSSNLLGFYYPEEIMKWYSPEDKCFVIKSEKLNETFGIWLPTIGMTTKFRQKRREEEQRGTEIDAAFYEYGPFIISNWRKIDMQTLSTLKFESVDWAPNKFAFIHKFTKKLTESALNKAASVCEKCKTQTESHIFLGGSFTIKDIFIISAGLDELI
jgi:hypothetical protein